MPYLSGVLTGIVLTILVVFLIDNIGPRIRHAGHRQLGLCWFSARLVGRESWRRGPTGGA